MTSPYSSHHSGPCSVVNPSSARRFMSRTTGSLPSGDSGGFSAFSSCIFLHQVNQVVDLERLAHVVVGAADARFLGDVAVAGENHVGNRLRLAARLERAA